MNLKRAMQFLSIFALMVWGGVFVYFYLTPAEDGTGPLIQKYVNANKNFDLWVLIAGMGLFVLAIFNVITFKQKSGICNHDHSHGDECDHDHDHQDHHDDHSVHTEACDHGHDHDHDHSDGHDHGEEHNHDHEQTTAGLAFSILILVVPVLVAANYSQGKFSPDYFRKLTQIESKMRAMEIEKNGGIVVQQTTMAEVKAAEEKAAKTADTPPDPSNEATTDVASFTMEDLKKMVPQNDAGSFMLEVPEIYYTAGDQQLMKVLEGVPVEFTAQVMNETVNNEAGNRLRAFRLLVECCAADARPISMSLEFSEKPPEFEEMGWFKMTGKLHYAKENDEWVPMLRVMEFNQTAEQIEMLY